MSELKNSVCFVIIMSYTNYMPQGRMLIRSLNSKYRSYYKKKYTPSGGTIEGLFVRTDYKVRQDIVSRLRTSEYLLAKILDSNIYVQDIVALLEFGQIIRDLKVNTKLLCLSQIIVTDGSFKAIKEEGNNFNKRTRQKQVAIINK